MDQAAPQPEPKPSRHDDQAQLNDLAQALTARARWPGAVLSPWVQRALLPEQAVQAASGVRQARPTALSESHTRALVQRAERHRTGSSRVWQPDVGSVAPATFEYFAGEIVERHRPIADKYHVQSAQEPGEESALPLAPAGQVGMVLGRRGAWPEARPAPSPPPPPAAVQQSPAQPRTAPPDRPSIQAPKQVRQRRNIRPMSRVEEITPATKMKMADMATVEGGPEIEAGLAEETSPDALPPPPRAAEPSPAAETERPPAVQRKAAPEGPATPPVTELKPEIEAGLPPIQREAPPEVPAAPPVAEAKPEVPGRPLVQREVPPQAPAAPPAREARPEAPDLPPVQREAAPEAPAAPPAQELKPEAPGLPPAREARPAAPDLPPVQREAPPEVPAAPPVAEVKPEAPDLPPVQREAPPEVPAAPPAREVKPEVPDLPPAQREAAPEAPAAPPVAEVKPEAPGLPPVQPEAPPVAEVKPEAPDLPLVQREAPPEVSAAPPVAEIKPEAPDLPLVQRETPPEAPAAPPAREARPEAPDLPLVQRAVPPEVEIKPEAPDLPPPQPEAPPAREARPEAPDLPLVQREARVPPQVVKETQPPPEPPLPESEPEAALPTSEAPAAEVEPQLPLGLEREVLARAQARAHLPLIEPLRPARGLEPEEEHVETPQDLRKPPPVSQIRPSTPMPVLRLPQVRLGGEGEAGVAPARSDGQPLPPAPRLSAGDMLQREALAISMDLAPPPRRVEVVQRLEGEVETVPSQAAEGGKPDLDRLARQVYPLIKRMLAVERERRFSR
ncbi:MAG: hypothetical protein JSV81_16535 [Anaerolineales bacterium]|nr:MAG: hypothetical protein JSV81_16535 [Anaerolineales bacterium]